MSPGIRALDPARDAAAVRGLYDRAADYLELETGRPPDNSVAAAFFSDLPPNVYPSAAHKLGLFLDGGELAGIADLAFGFPEPDDAYIGLLLLDPARRGQGLGAVFLGHLVGLARRRGAPRLLLAVLDANPRGRAFWERHGFRVTLTAPPARLGDRTQVRHRMERPLDPAEAPPPLSRR